MAGWWRTCYRRPLGTIPGTNPADPAPGPTLVPAVASHGGAGSGGWPTTTKYCSSCSTAVGGGAAAAVASVPARKTLASSVPALRRASVFWMGTGQKKGNRF